jgi:hypothetical protein
LANHFSTTFAPTEIAMALNSAAYGMYPQDVALNSVVHTLNQAGFDNEDICMLLSPTHPIASLVKDASVFNAESKANGATAGLIGWLSGFGAVVIPTVGFFIRSQAFFRALMTHENPAICGNARTLSGLGFSDDQADHFEHELRKVGVMVYVSCAESARTVWACEILRHTGAHEISTLRDLLPAAVNAAVA